MLVYLISVCKRGPWWPRNTKTWEQLVATWHSWGCTVITSCVHTSGESLLKEIDLGTCWLQFSPRMSDTCLTIVSIYCHTVIFAAVNQAIIDSDNSLSTAWCQTNMWTNTDHCQWDTQVQYSMKLADSWWPRKLRQLQNLVISYDNLKIWYMSKSIHCLSFWTPDLSRSGDVHSPMFCYWSNDFLSSNL